MSVTPPDPSLTTTISQDIYSTLVGALQCYSSHIIDLEILPSSYPLPPDAKSPILQDGTSLAIPKKALVQAFLVAREILFRDPTYLDYVVKLQRGVDDFEEPEKIFEATKVILLYDPEHLTAANWRKKYVRTNIWSYIDEGLLLDGLDTISKFLRQELAFLSSVLTSPLNRHVKSPTLWHHRFWLIKESRSYLLDHPDDKSRASQTAFYAAEIDIITSAASRHKSNFYAWQYGRKLLTFLTGQNQHIPWKHESTPIDIVSEKVTQDVQKWCLAHPSDISGFSFLEFLLRPRSQIINETKVTFQYGDLSKTIVRGTEQFVQNIAWKGESVGWFLETMRRRLDDMTAIKQA